MGNILSAVLWFAALGAILGILLAIASKIFAVRVDERIPKITEALPGANCGGCGYAGCAALAQAVVDGNAKSSACTVGGDETARRIAEIMGVTVEAPVRMRAQVMCSGAHNIALKKYVYKGAPDCIAAASMGGGDKLCPNGCIGLGSCVSVCPFNAISVVNGIAAVDYTKCKGCGLCANTCPKHIIRLIPYESRHWVGCMSVDRGNITRSYCNAGCIGCKICEKNCPTGAIRVVNSVAEIEYSKCTACGLCAEKCPRKIIWSSELQKYGLALEQENTSSI